MSNPIELMQQGNYQAAQAGFKQQLINNPTEQVAAHFYGLLSVILNDYHHGLAYLNLALTLKVPSQGQLNNLLQAINVFNSNNHQKAAESLLVQLTTLAESNHDIALALAAYHLQNKQPHDCLNLLSYYNKQDFEAHYYRAIAHKLLDKNTAAKSAMTKAMHIKPYHRLYATQNATKKPRLLLLYALEELDFKAHIEQEISFSIFGGHFDVHMFVDTHRYNISRLFVSDCDAFHHALAKLKDYDIVINCIADAEVCQSSLALLAHHLPKNTLLINPPAAIAITTRVDICDQLSELDIALARTSQLVIQDDTVNQFIDNMPSNDSYPLLARPLGSSTGIGLEKLNTPQDLREYQINAADEPINLCPFIDFKSHDGLYRKYRVFVIDGEIYPEHCVAHNHWNVHSSSRLTLMQYDETLKAQEQEFVNDYTKVLTPHHIAQIKHIYQLLQLDYFGIDFSITQQGELLLFEANAGMRVNPDYINSFNYLVQPIDNIINAFRGMIASKISKKNAAE